VTGEVAVAGGTGEYTMFGLVSCAAFWELDVSSIGSVQYVKPVAGSVVLKDPLGPSVL
jgi:hypothetical protein